MDAFKDVMLSEPPSRITAAPVPATYTQPAFTFESYKGMLLCERPTHLLPREHHEGAKPFIPGGLRRPQEEAKDPTVGLCPSIEDRVHREVRRLNRGGSSETKTASIVSRHKRWLRSFAASVKKLQADRVEEQIAAEARDRRLREREMQLRQERVYSEQDAPSTALAITNDASAADGTRRKDTPAATSREGTRDTAAPKGAAKASRPKWSLTEEEAFDAELEANKDLLEFAKELNYERYIADFEVQEALAILRERVKELQVEVDAADVAQSDDVTSQGDRPTGGGAVAPRRLLPTIAKPQGNGGGAGGAPIDADDRAAWDASTNVGLRVRQALSNDSLLLADKLLAQSESLRQVHTKNSLARLLQDITLKDSLGARLQGAAVLSQRVESGVAPPVVSNVAAANTGLEAQGAPQRILKELRASKTHVQNLPYLYRCPSL